MLNADWLIVIVSASLAQQRQTIEHRGFNEWIQMGYVHIGSCMPHRQLKISETKVNIHQELHKMQGFSGNRIIRTASNHIGCSVCLQKFVTVVRLLPRTRSLYKYITHFASHCQWNRNEFLIAMPSEMWRKKMRAAEWFEHAASRNGIPSVFRPMNARQSYAICNALFCPLSFLCFFSQLLACSMLTEYR